MSQAQKEEFIHFGMDLEFFTDAHSGLAQNAEEHPFQAG